MKRVIITIMSMMLAVFFASAQNWMKVDRKSFYDLKKTPFSKIKMKEGDKAKLWLERGNKGASASVLVKFSDQPDVQSGDYCANAFLVSVSIDNNTIDKSNKGFTKLSDGWYEYDFGKTLYVSDIGRDVGTTNFCNPIYILPEETSIQPSINLDKDSLCAAIKRIMKSMIESGEYERWTDKNWGVYQELLGIEGMDKQIKKLGMSENEILFLIGGMKGEIIQENSLERQKKAEENLKNKDGILTLDLTQSGYYVFGFARRDDIKQLIVQGEANILRNAFKDCKNLRKISFIVDKLSYHNGEIIIESNAFENCENLETIEIIDNTEMGNKVLFKKDAFLNCKKLTTLILPHIEKTLLRRYEIFYDDDLWSAFAGCDKISTIIDKDGNFILPFSLYSQSGLSKSFDELPDIPYKANSIAAKKNMDAKLIAERKANAAKEAAEKAKKNQLLAQLKNKHGVSNLLPGESEGLYPKEGVPIQFYKDISANYSVFGSEWGLTGPFMLTTREALNFGSGTQRYRYGKYSLWDLYVKNGKVIYVQYLYNINEEVIKGILKTF